tara:strand:- start:3114 stop:3590 length:477 start_codon:yes stop_codon:yes gene_type:complete
MIKELNLKQEKFCQAYAMLRNATESAKSAGYSSVSAHTQGHRLIQREDIKERIEELEKEIETKIDVVSEIESQYTYAKNNGHTNSALKALEVLSKVRTVKDEEVVKPIAELEQDIINNLEILGEERASKIFLGCKWFLEEEEEDIEEELEESEETATV